MSEEIRGIKGLNEDGTTFTIRRMTPEEEAAALAERKDVLGLMPALFVDITPDAQVKLDALGVYHNQVLDDHLDQAESVYETHASFFNLPDGTSVYTCTTEHDDGWHVTTCLPEER